MKKTLILALTFLLLLSTAGMASAVNLSLTIKALGDYRFIEDGPVWDMVERPSIEAGIYLGEKLELTVGFDYLGEFSSFYGYKESGYVMEISPGIRCYYKKAGKVDYFFFGRLKNTLYGGDFHPPEESILAINGGLGFAYNIDPRFAVITEAGLQWYNKKDNDWSFTTTTIFYAAGFKYLF